MPSTKLQTVVTAMIKRTCGPDSQVLGVDFIGGDIPHADIKFIPGSRQNGLANLEEAAGERFAQFNTHVLPLEGESTVNILSLQGTPQDLAVAAEGGPVKRQKRLLETVETPAGTSAANLIARRARQTRTRGGHGS